MPRSSRRRFLQLLAAGGASALSNVNAAQRSQLPRVLLFTAIDVGYAADNVGHWADQVGINGFLLPYVAEWWSPSRQAFRRRQALEKLNSLGNAAGLDRNFVKIALGYGRLPDWRSASEWDEVLTNLRRLATMLRETGTRGVAIDTEPYETNLFDSRKSPYMEADRDGIARTIAKRGREIGEALAQGFPGIEVFVFPEGAFYWFVPGQAAAPHDYELWIHLYDGLVAAKGVGRVVVGAERTYHVLSRDSLRKPFESMDKTMQQRAADPSVWRSRSSIALGMWPLGKTYSDKSANYAVEEFQSQLSDAASLCPDYVWIYDHGVAWSQMSAHQLSRYTAGGEWIWGAEYQTLSRDRNVDGYYGVLRRYQQRRRQIAAGVQPFHHAGRT